MSTKQGGKAKPLKVAKKKYAQDRLSELPDDILIYHILVLLPMKEAARTTILRRRWRSIRTLIWEFIPEPNLLKNKIAQMPTPKWISGERPPESLIKREEELVAIETVSKYADWVNRVISAKSIEAGGRILLKFSLHMPFTRTKDLSGKVDSWLTFALGDKGTQELELYFYVAYSGYRACYKFPSIELQPHLFPQLRLLNSLKLRGVRIKSKTLESLLRRCELLERLHLEGIWSLDRIEIAGPVSRLKYINLFHVSFPGIGSIPVVISASTPDLVSLRYHHNTEVTLNGNAPRLIDLSICPSIRQHGYDLRSHPLSCYISQLQSLHLDLGYWTEIADWLHLVPDLNGLKHLSLSLESDLNFSMQTLRGIISLINSASGLQHLTLDLLRMSLQKFRANFDESADLQLHCLRVLEFANFVGTEMECSTAEYVIKGVNSSVKRVILESRTQIFKVIYPPEDELERWRTCVVKPILPPEAELIVINRIHDYDNYYGAE